jgi:predicted aspartyl protease
MSDSFNPSYGLILVPVDVMGPAGIARYDLALDTGATATVITTPLLVALGYDPATAPNRWPVTTASGVEYAARIPVSRISALGQGRTNFPVLCMPLPPSSGIDGVLGLDFLRGLTVTIDFRTGTVSLA